jgi:predicted RNA-binding Zn-ribbon protein involved in translation (DUF1610 family)
MAEEELDTAGAAGMVDDSEFDNTENGTIIRDTDIVFDCPHCGHNLAIDYRGAGLQINCVQCGESVLVPIPDGMKIDDLDIEPGEILKQLFKTRRDLQKQELRAEGLEEQVRGLVERNSMLYAQCEALAMQVAELRTFCQQHASVSEKMVALLDRMSTSLANDAAPTEAGGENAEAATEA